MSIARVGQGWVLGMTLAAAVVASGCSEAADGGGSGSGRAESVPSVAVSAQALNSTPGNGKLESGEECDDGNTDNGDGCSSTGTLEGNHYCWVPGAACSPKSECGNKRLDSGEACDKSSTKSPGQGCSNQCDLTDCGNRKVELSLWPNWQNEICDDGNRFDGDGCTRLCEVEPAFACKGEPSRCLLSGITFYNTGVDEDGRVMRDGYDPHWRYSLDDHKAEIVEEDELAYDWPTISQTSWTINNYKGHYPADRPGCVYQEFTIPSTFRIDAFRMVLATFNDNEFVSASVNGKAAATKVLLVPEGGAAWQKMVMREVSSSADWVIGQNRLELCNDPVFDGPTGSRYILADAYDDLCGDGFVSAREECDDGNDDDGDGCSETCGIEPGYGCVGEPSECALTCGNGLLNPGEQCDDGDLISGDGCSSSCRIEDGFTCPTPDTACLPICGDGDVVSGEQCDDGNTLPSDGCAPNCRVEPGYACDGNPSACERLCGNGVLDGREQCDDGNRTSGDGCSLACTLEGGYVCPNPAQPCRLTCGNGTLNAGEECDDDNLVSGDGCNSECALEPGWLCADGTCVMSCGNGTVDAGEECDDQNLDDTDGCTANCTESDGYDCTGSGASTVCATSCGDGIVAGAEECDDLSSPAADGNGCSATCTVESGFVCPPPGTSCFNTCGNGAIDVGEDCDDNGVVDGDGCSSTCEYEDGFDCSGPLGPCSPVCGDGIQVAGEACDDGNLNNSDACTNACKLGPDQPCTDSDQCAAICNPLSNECAPEDVCGNGVVEVDNDEVCDDGNTMDGDGCSKRCLFEQGAGPCSDSDECETGVCDQQDSDACEPEDACGNGVVEVGEVCDDGNTVDADGCSSECKYEEGGGPCNSNDECASDVCDQGENGSDQCEPAEVCGNGIVEAGEVCDDGNTVADGNNLCDANCLWADTAPCNGGTECASGVCNAADGTCHPAGVCPNGLREGLEVCDDGNTVDDDACSNNCKRGDGEPCNVDLVCESGLCNRPARECAPVNTCPNGTVEAPEVCDDGNSVDDDGCTNGCLIGPTGNCDEDSDCPPGEVCDTASSYRCEPENGCGNGHLDAGESCDDGNTVLGDGCSAACLIEDGGDCANDIECESGLCNTTGSGECAPVNACGNGAAESGEECDDGNPVDNDGCTSCVLDPGQPCVDGQCGSNVCDTQGSNTCELVDTCGNGLVEGNEACDDGNRQRGDGCSAICRLENTEPCTDDNQCMSFICNPVSDNCAPRNQCGNGVVEADEGCDDGGNVDNDGCSAICLLEDGEDCTDVDDCEGVCDIQDSDACEPADTCGNGLIEGNERCDDGNTANGDGCSASCKVEDGGGCDDPSDCVSALCSAGGNCQPLDVCGNGRVETGEACDDGNTESADGCSSICEVEGGFPCDETGDCTTGFVCDTAGSADCEPIDECGNGVIEGDEGCDDGDILSGDGCSALCRLEDGERCYSNDVCEHLRCGLDQRCGALPDQSCEADTECRGPITCDPHDARCGAPEGSECGFSAECRSLTCGADGTCLAPPGKACTSNEQCANGVCASDGKCGALPGDACDTRLVCRFLSCDSDIGQCRKPPGGDCTTGAECIGGVCDAGQCGGAPGASCERDLDCRSLTCHPTTKVCLTPPGGACTDEQSCSGQVCGSDGKCGGEPGAACELDDQCKSHYCDPGDKLCAPDLGRGCVANERCRSGLCNLLVDNVCVGPGLCGNGTVEGDEACDDGALSDGDGCSSTCKVEEGGDCDADADCVTASCDADSMTCVLPGEPDAGTDAGSMSDDDAGVGGDGGMPDAGADAGEVTPAEDGAELSGGGCAVARGEASNSNAWLNLAWLGLALTLVGARRRRRSTKGPALSAATFRGVARWLAVAWLGFVLAGVTSRAYAQQGFALNQFDPAVIGSDWFDGDSLDFRGHGRPAFGVTLDYAHEPLVARDTNDEITATPVQNQMFVHLAGAVNLWERLRLDIVLPLAAWNRGETATVDGITYPAPSDSGVGDLRLGADLRLVGKYQGAFSLALGMHVRLPTGSRDAYTSDGATQLGGRLLAAGDLAWFAYSLRIGIEGRFEETTVDGVAVGNELTYGATAGVRFAEKHGLIGVEWYGGGGLVSGSTFDPKTLPQELLGSFSYRVGDVLLGAAAGPGLTEAFGSPVVRALARLVWFPEPKEPPPPPPEEPPPPPPDCDGDGVINDEDACPAAPGPRSDDPAMNGCPPPVDTDGDGFIDLEDACPRDTGVSSEDPTKNGCPPPDPDRDHDGILNDDDACPDAAGRPNPEPKRNGCPIVMVTDSRIEISQRVEFDTNKASIDKVSFELLDEVAKILIAHPEIRLVEVEGHTDTKGSAARNRKLSKQRADSVKKYLVNKGVDAERLLASGRGPDVPIADNDTEAGRTANRRVEFNIRRRDPTPTKLVEVPLPADGAAPAGSTTP